MKRTPILAAVVLAGSLALTGCGTTDTTAPAATGPAPAAATQPALEPAPAPTPTETEPAETTPTVGQPFTVNMGQGGTARITVVSARRVTVPESSFAPAPKNGTGWLVLDVLWETEQGTTPCNPFYFQAKDANGRRGDYAIAVAADELTSGDVPAGDRMRGGVAFDVADGPVTVVVTDAGLREAARFTIDPTAI